MQTETTRRVLFGGAGIEALAVAIPPAAAVYASAADALEPFARSWLAQWTHLGGTYSHGIVGGKGWVMGWPEYDCSPVYDDDLASAGGEDHWQSRRTYAAARYDGQMFALRELIRSVPGGADAVRALVLAKPTLGQMRARKVVA